jgi:hypothetical protein
MRSCSYRRQLPQQFLGTDSTTGMSEGKPTRSAGPPAARAPEAVRQQERYGGQRASGRVGTLARGTIWGDNLLGPDSHDPGICNMT